MSWTLLGRLSGYFHQDWPLDYANADAAVRAFLSDLSAQERAALHDEVVDLATLDSDDAIKHVLVDELRIDYWPPGDGVTFQEWVGRLSGLLSEASEESRDASDPVRPSDESPGDTRYVCGRWLESRGDAFDAWGPSTWWFAIQGTDVHTQVEVYDHGPTLLYDKQHAEDPYGRRATELPIEHLDEVTAEAFHRALSEHPPANRVPVPLGCWGRITTPASDAGSFVMVEVETGEGWKKPPPSDAVRLWIRDPSRPHDLDANRTTWLHAADVPDHLQDWGVEVSEWLPHGVEP